MNEGAARAPMDGRRFWTSRMAFRFSGCFAIRYRRFALWPGLRRFGWRSLRITLSLVLDSVSFGSSGWRRFRFITTPLLGARMARWGVDQCSCKKAGGPTRRLPHQVYDGRY